MSMPCNLNIEHQRVIKLFLNPLLLIQVLFVFLQVKRLVEFQKRRELFMMTRLKMKFGGEMLISHRLLRDMQEVELELLTA